MSSSLPPPPSREIDLDATAELPVVELTPALAEKLGETDTLAGPVVPAGVSELAETMRELESRLQRRDERISLLERLLAEARDREQALRSEADQERRAALEHTAEVDRHLADADHEVVTLRDEMDRREVTLLGIQVEIDGQRRALAHSRAELEQRHAAFRHQAMDLADLRSRCERQMEALQSAAAWRAVDAARIQTLEAQLSGLKIPVPAAPTVPVAALVPLAVPAAAPGPPASPPPPATAANLTAGEAEAARAAISVYAQQQHEIEQLQEELAQLHQRMGELEAELATAREELDTARGDLTAARDELATARERAEDLESEIHTSAALLGSTQDIMARPDPGDSGTRPELKVLNPELPQRLLVRQEGSTGISYPLGRRTTIGRTPDNDIQIDTTYVSRHHAVLLGSAQECILEDLNSTNGVLVNGRKAGRQALRDGDTITIGSAVFTFLQSE